MGMAILFFVIFLAFPPGLFMAGKWMKNYLRQMMFGRRSKTAIREAERREGFNEKAAKRIKFTLRDPRTKPIPFRIVFLLIYAIGTGISLFAGYNANWKLLLASIVVAYIGLIFAYISSNNIISERDIVLGRMLELKGSKMRLVDRESKGRANMNSEFKVTKWSDDLIHPEKMYLYMPTDFDILEVDRFLESFNLVFGGNGQWISDDTDDNYNGFDFNAGVAAIRVSPPLPKIAMWHERYLDERFIHWSFFPLALGSENGVPIYNEELGVTENVLGFAVNSGQEKLSTKNEVAIGPEITAAPQILFAGGTGGGKALSSDTKIVVKRDGSDSNVEIKGKKGVNK